MLPLLKRDLKLAVRGAYGLTSILAFYTIACFIFMFAYSQDGTIFAKTYPAIIFINALMAAILTIPEIIRKDYESKILEQIYLQSVSLQKITLSKIISHWLTTGLPLSVFAYVSCIFAATEHHFAFRMFLSMLFASPIISIIAVLTSTITLGVKNGNIIAPIIAIPLYIPLMVFSLTNIEGSALLPFSAFLYSASNILGLLLILLPLGVFVGGLALSAAIEE